MQEPKPFDAAAHMRKIRTRNGMQDYLDVRWRVAWFNADHPLDGSIITEIVSHDETHARFKAMVSIESSGFARMFSGHGSETQQDFPDFFEKAETKAIGRALALAGYGTDMAADLDDGEPMDGRAAAKDERAQRRATPEERREIEGQHERNGAQSPPAAAPRRAARTLGSGGAAAIDDRSNVHQHEQLRTLAGHGFALAARLQQLNVRTIEELTVQQAKELIIEGRAAVRERK